MKAESLRCRFGQTDEESVNSETLYLKLSREEKKMGKTYDIYEK